MKLKELLELLKDYSDNADVCVVEYDPATCEKSYYRIAGFETLDWGASFELRVVREEKPDVVRYAITTDTFVEMCPTGCACGQAEIKLTFDGETLKLKAVEMIGRK